MLLSLLDGEGVQGDGLALSLVVLRVNSEDIRASGLEPGHVEVGVVALNFRHCHEVVAVFGFEDECLRKASVVTSVALNLKSMFISHYALGWINMNGI